LPAGVSAKENKRVLAREGEAQNGQIPKQVLWDALRNCKDQQLYIADINIVELGYIYNLSMDDDGVVKVLMTMPHRGTTIVKFLYLGFEFGASCLSKTIMEALTGIPGVRKVIVDQTWYPEWNSNFISEEGRKKLGI
jgi:metal-sulfur cluster biosynthetic enzyme